MRVRLGVALLLCLASLSAAPVLSATTIAVRTWTGRVSGSWADPGNWDTGAPATGDDVVFSDRAPNPSTTNDLPDGVVLHSIVIQRLDFAVGGKPLYVS